MFSVLIANYNNGRFLQEAVESVKNQSYTSWEIVLVDDGSSDMSFQVYETLKSDNRIRLFYNEKNQGCGFAKARCIEEAKGEICAFLDPDDALTPDALQVMVDGHREHPDAAIVYSTHYLCDEDLNIQEINPTVGQIPPEHSYLSYKNVPIRVSAFASFKKELYNKTPKLDPALKRAVDQDLYCKLEETGSLIYIDKPLYYYRWHKGGISTYDNFIKGRYWYAQVIKEAYKRRKNMPHIRNISKKDLNFYFSQFYVWKAMEKQKNFEACKVLYCLARSYRYSVFDQNFTIRIKMLLGMIKNWHKYIKN